MSARQVAVYSSAGFPDAQGIEEENVAQLKKAPHCELSGEMNSEFSQGLTAGIRTM